MSKSLFADLAEAALDQQGLRRTALFLHGLHPEDRDLLVNGLSAAQRQAVVPLLHELDALGLLPIDAADGLARLPWPEPAREELDADWLGRADPRAVCEVLVREPDVLVARVLRINAWPWRSQVLVALGDARRAGVNERLLDPAERHREHARLDAALLRQLRRTMEHRRTALHASAPTSPVAAQRQWARWPVGWWARWRAERAT